jgi:hypothetical protein
VTIGQVESLMRHWAHTPPAAFALKRIGLFLGLKPEQPAPSPVTTARDALDEARAADVPVLEGRALDPVLDMLDELGW